MPAEVQNDLTPHLTGKIAIILMVTALVLLSTRIWLKGTSEFSDDHSWLLAINVEFSADSVHGARVSLKQPYESERVRLTQRTVHHAGMQLVHRKLKGQSIREITVRPREAGEYYLSVEFFLQSSSSSHFFSLNPSVLSEQDRTNFLLVDDTLHLNDMAYQEISDAINLDNTEKDAVPEKLVNFLFNLPTSDTVKDHDLSDALSLGSLTVSQKARVLVSICRKLNIPSRLVTGVVLKDDPETQMSVWAEVHEGGVWVPYHPARGAIKELAPHYVAIDKTGQGVVTSENVQILDWGIEIEELPQSAPHQGVGQRQWHDIFNLNRLPADIREQLMLLALLPLGALITAIVRQFAGFHSYGVFTPTMLALAMVYTDTVTTMIILLVIAIAVYVGKPAMHPSISRTPRLSIIFVFVALSMLLGVSVLDYMNLSTEGHLILLPIVILTSLVDRFLQAMEKVGQFIALYRLFWTSVISLAIVPVLGLDWLGYQLLSYPEVHLITVALLLLMADYKGRKLLENKYVDFLAEDKLKSRFS